MEGSGVSLIPLNIAMDYPINWDLKRVLRDLIQNFYDSIGYEKFDKEFIYTWTENESGHYDVEMATHGHPFNYEWLTYIGGSTKTNSPGDYIGMYGEGFKMCILCLERLGWGTVTMESQTWRITPCQYTKVIEGRVISMLGYELEERGDDEWTKFKMCNIPKSYCSTLQQALLDFFYPENILFGNKLYETDNYSIYERSEVSIPGDAYTARFKGVLYCNFLARGLLPFDAIILERKDMRNKDTRKREVLEEYEVKEILYRLFEKFDSKASYIVLEKMEQHWCDMPEKMVDLETWYYAICQLVRNVSRDEELVRKFKEKYGDLVYIERKTADGIRNQLIEQTKRWHGRATGKKLVNPIFRLLGAKSLVEEYQKIKMTMFEETSEKEEIYIRLLFDSISAVFPYKLYDEKPNVVIQRDGKKKWGPLIFATRRYSKKRKDKRKYQIEQVVMQHEDFDVGKFSNTLVKFADILIHAYGTTKNANINALLTEFGGACIKHRELLSRCAEVWDARIEL